MEERSRGGTSFNCLASIPFVLALMLSRKTGGGKGSSNTSQAEPRIPRRERTHIAQPRYLAILGTILVGSSRTRIDEEMPSVAWRGSGCFIVLARFRSTSRKKTKGTTVEPEDRRSEIGDYKYNLERTDVSIEVTILDPKAISCHDEKKEKNDSRRRRIVDPCTSPRDRRISGNRWGLMLLCVYLGVPGVPGFLLLLYTPDNPRDSHSRYYHVPSPPSPWCPCLPTC